MGMGACRASSAGSGLDAFNRAGVVPVVTGTAEEGIARRGRRESGNGSGSGSGGVEVEKGSCNLGKRGCG